MNARAIPFRNRAAPATATISHRSAQACQ
jgi:hypothetical protein